MEGTSKRVKKQYSYLLLLLHASPAIMFWPTYL